MENKLLRVLVAKLGLDGHDRGAKIIARMFRDNGMEVIYTGIRQTPSMVTRATLEEDVDLIGISILSGAHMDLIPLLFQELEDKGLSDIPVIVGGIIPDQDRNKLLDMGASVTYSDPYIDRIPKTRKYNLDIQSVSLNAKNIQSADLILLATDHDDFDYTLIEKQAQLIVDTRGRFRPSSKIIKA